MECAQTLFEEDLKNFPAALKPCYTTKEPNDPILLYQDRMKISRKLNEHQIELEGKGKVEYIWFPFPHLEFEFVGQEQDINSKINFNEREYILALCVLDTSVKVKRNEIVLSGDNVIISGRLDEPLIQRNSEGLTYVLFHMTNLFEFIGDYCSVIVEKDSRQTCSRTILIAEGWRITLDQIKINSETENLLDRQGGFAITHIGKLELENGETFSGEQAQEILERLSDFLSFARGFRVAAILLSGYNTSEKKVWQSWVSQEIDPWQVVRSCFPSPEARYLNQMFPGFLQKWQEWGKEEKLSLYRYLEANLSTTVLEQKIILAQIALELIAYQEGFADGLASEKIRKLLNKYKIPNNLVLYCVITPQSSLLIENLIELKELFEKQLREKIHQEPKANKQEKIQKELNEVDYPYLFTKMRNDIVHASKEIAEREKYLQGIAYLGLWYLELVFLAIMGYQGDYSNRLLQRRQNGQKEPVPWSSKLS